MKRLICMLLCLAFVCVAFIGCQSEDSSESESGTESVTETAGDLINIKTKYCVLKYPAKWGDAFSAKINEDKEYTVSFMYGGKPVFDIILNGKSGSPLGMIDTDNGKVTVRVKTYEFDQKDKNYNIYREMQDDLNVIIDNLKKDYTFTADDTDPDNTEVYEIKTSKASLYYPKKWEKEVKTAVDGDRVSFTYNGTKLFDIVFGEAKDGDVLGTYDGTQVCIVDYPLDKKKLKSEDVKKMTAMKEDVNVIIDNLSKDKKFSKGGD